jgi:hypothetical protein
MAEELVHEEKVDGNYLSTIVDAVRLNPELAKDPEIEALLKLANGQVKTTKNEEKNDEVVEDEPTTTTIDEVEYNLDDKGNAVDDKGKVVFTAEQIAEKTKPEEPEVESTFFSKTTKKAKTGSAFLDLDKVKDWAKSEMGIDTTKKDWDNTLKSTVSKWRKDSQQVPELNDKLEGVTKLFTDIGQNQPVLAEAIRTYGNGGDPNEVFKTALTSLDFNKKADDYDNKTLLLHYFPEDFKPEDFRKKEEWEDEDEFKEKQKEINRTLSIARKNFDADKKEVLQKRALQQQKIEALNREYKASVKSSVETLKTEFPDFKQKDVDNIQVTLEKGEDELLAQYLEKNGSLKKDAAVKLAMAKFGQKELNTLKGEIDRLHKIIDEQSEQLEGIVDRGKTKPTKQKKGELPIDTAAQQIIQSHGFMNKKSKYF